MKDGIVIGELMYNDKSPPLVIDSVTIPHLQPVYVTVQAKTSLAHTSNFTWLMICKTSLEYYSNLKFSVMSNLLILTLYVFPTKSYSGKFELGWFSLGWSHMW